MSRCRTCDIKKVREITGHSQSELAVSLGVSKRAVQSYEQGWREIPLHVLKALAMLLFLNWRKDQTWVAPCWDVNNCPAEKKECCPAWKLRAGDVCWEVHGTKCERTTARSWKTKAGRCLRCPVTARWLPQ